MQQNKGVEQEGESTRMVDPNPGGQGREVQTQLSWTREKRTRGSLQKKSEGDPQNESVTKHWGKLRI